MASLKLWILTARLRTLPLSISGILIGNGFAFGIDFSWSVFTLTIIITIVLQVLSNFANDYGDGMKGTDGEDRIGPPRALQSGLLTPKQLLRAIVFLAVLSLIFSVVLLFTAFDTSEIPYVVLSLILLIAAVLAAIKYTVGSNPYGYRTLGDFFVFVFFGWVSVLGSFLVQKHYLDFPLLLLGTAIGFLCVGVLNLNNMRDIEGDKKANKITLAVMLGKDKSKYYHAFLVLGALTSSFCYLFFMKNSYTSYLYLITAFPLLTHLKRVFSYKKQRFFDKELKVLSLITFFFSLLLVVGNLI